MIRLLFWLLLSPVWVLRWVIKKLFLILRGYNLLAVKIYGPLPDRHGPMGLLSALGGERRGPDLLEVLLALDRARRDKRVRAVWVELGPLSSGLARAEEVQKALARVRDAGKRVVVYMEDAGLAEYLAALGASEIALAPAGGLRVTGVASEVVFVKGLLDRAGVVARLRARGEYKSARETFAEPAMTDPNREMTEALVSDLFEQLVETIAQNRGLPPDAVRRCLDDGPFLPDEAKKAGLVDHVRYRDEMERDIEDALGDARRLDAPAYLRLSSHLVGRGRPKIVALLEVAGHIKSGRSVPGADGPRATGSRTFVRDVERVAGDARVQAIVLRVDSPGGSALASDVMWRALGRAREKKPIIVSMANVAASGGYFVSGIEDVRILASQTTLTGSIGVLGGKFETRGLYDKLGIRKEVIARGRRAAYFSDYVAMSNADLAKLDADLDRHYRDFVQKMADGRRRTYEELDAVARGRVWTGRQALDQGLVDAHGGLMDALAEARRQLGVSETAPLALTASPAERRRLPLRLEWAVPKNILPDTALVPWHLLGELERDRVFALLPFDIRFR